MNLTLTMQFDNLDQLQSFLNRNPSAAALPVATAAVETAAPAAVAQPAAAPVAAAPVAAAPVAAAPVAAAPVAAAPLAAVPTPTTAPAADPATIRQTTMNRLRELAGAMDDPGVLGQFINGFGVARYSDLPDDQLVAFQTALGTEFGQ